MKKLVFAAVAIAVVVSAASAVMAIGGQPSDELEALRARVARLEAKEEVLSAFNQYLYGIDTGFKEDILDIFAEDAVLDVPNFPPRNEDLHFEGRDELAPLYAMYSRRPPHIGGGHHTANIAINVRPDLTHADLSSYFMTSGQSGVQGGRYEGVMRKEADGKWRWETLTITSAWGFRAEHFDTISEPVSADKYSPRGGHHAAYQSY
jgi:ketosteroid isomerase-like protein